MFYLAVHRGSVVYWYFTRIVCWYAYVMSEAFLHQSACSRGAICLVSLATDLSMMMAASLDVSLSARICPHHEYEPKAMRVVAGAR